ncbi:MAG: acyl-CoA/acyl-ACP dehydrogenase [Terricaulis sp.]|nr:acyl-CoA/acyl-ACP dehydrogenase [Terricaulis sp.]
MAVLTEEQNLLRDAAEAWAQERSPLGALRKIRANGDGLGFDAQAFAEMAEMGWAGIVVPEEFGGADFGFHSMGVVLEQLGRTLTASPLIVSSLAAATGLKRAGSAALKQAWLPKIAAGEAIVTLAIDEGVRHNPAATELRAKKSGAGFKLSGVKRPVLFGMAAHAAIIAARTSGEPGDEAGITLFLAPTDAAKLSRAPLIEIEARGAAAYDFGGVTLGPEAVLGAVDEGGPLLERMLDCACAGLAAQMLGSASAAFEITLAYLKTRKQFGQLIGAFQALQHRASVLLGELELTRSAVESALDALDADAPETHELASLAKALAGDTFRRVAGEMIQMHGGIGMTDEHDAGLFLKRARIDDMSFGGAGYHRERYGRLAGY